MKFEKLLLIHLVLASSPDVSADVDDLLADRVSRQQVIELLHGFVDDVLHCAGNIHL